MKSFSVIQRAVLRATVLTACVSMLSQCMLIDATVQDGAANQSLAGVTWNTGKIERLGMAPPSVRFSANLDQASLSPSVLDLSEAIEEAHRVQAIGSTPVVTLNHTPKWLARPVPEDCVEDRREVSCSYDAMAPSDFVAWRQLIRNSAYVLATQAGVKTFEVWNEPNNTRSWADTDEMFLLTAIASHQGVADASKMVGFKLEIGGPAVGGGPSDLLKQYVRATTEAGVPPAFVSWHRYTRDPAAYRQDAATVEVMAPGLPQAVTEWNYYGRKDGARLDLRGAAFALASLIEMEAAGIDRATFYRSVAYADDTAGLVSGPGVKRPSWWAFYAWGQTTPGATRVRVVSTDADVWARATRRGDRLDVLLAVYGDQTGARTIQVSVVGCAITSGRWLELDGFSPPRPVSSSLVVQSPTVAWLAGSC